MAVAGWRREIPLFALPWFQNNVSLSVSAESGKQRFSCAHIFSHWVVFLSENLIYTASDRYYHLYFHSRNVADYYYWLPGGE